MIKFNINIWDEGSLKGMREIDTNEFSYTELSETHYGYQGPEGIDQVFKKEIISRCDKILDEVQEFHDFMHSVDFIAKLEERELPRTLSHLNSFDYACINRSIKDPKYHTSTPEDIEYIMENRLTGLSPKSLIEVHSILLSRGIRYQFK